MSNKGPTPKIINFPSVVKGIDCLGTNNIELDNKYAKTMFELLTTSNDTNLVFGENVKEEFQQKAYTNNSKEKIKSCYLSTFYGFDADNCEIEGSHVSHHTHNTDIEKSKLKVEITGQLGFEGSTLSRVETTLELNGKVNSRLIHLPRKSGQIEKFGTTSNVNQKEKGKTILEIDHERFVDILNLYEGFVITKDSSLFSDIDYNELKLFLMINKKREMLCSLMDINAKDARYYLEQYEEPLTRKRNK